MKNKFLFFSTIIFCLPVNHVFVSKVCCGDRPGLGDEEGDSAAEERRRRREEGREDRKKRNAEENARQDAIRARALSDTEMQNLQVRVDKAVRGNPDLLREMQNFKKSKDKDQTRLGVKNQIRNIIQGIAMKDPFYRVEGSQEEEHLVQTYSKWADELMDKYDSHMLGNILKVGLLAGGGYALYKHGETKGKEAAKKGTGRRRSRDSEGSRKKTRSGDLEESEISESFGSGSSYEKLSEEPTYYED
jgi:hypothetical protein